MCLLFRMWRRMMCRRGKALMWIIRFYNIHGYGTAPAHEGTIPVNRRTKSLGANRSEQWPKPTTKNAAVRPTPAARFKEKRLTEKLRQHLAPNSKKQCGTRRAAKSRSSAPKPRSLQDGCSTPIGSCSPSTYRDLGQTESPDRKTSRPDWARRPPKLV